MELTLDREGFKSERAVLAIMDWHHHRYDISDEFAERLRSTVSVPFATMVQVERTKWTLTSANGEERDVTLAKLWVEAFKKGQVDFYDLYNTEVPKLVIPKFKPGRDDKRFLSLVEKADEVRVTERVRKWRYEEPSKGDRKLGIFVYTINQSRTASAKLVASIDATYSDSKPNSLHVNYVNTHYDYRGLGLCKRMFSTMASYLRDTGRATSIDLENAAGVVGCKCYVGGASEAGFVTEDIWGDVFSPDRCAVQYNLAKFEFNHRLTLCNSMTSDAELEGLARRFGISLVTAVRQKTKARSTLRREINIAIRAATK